MVPVGFVVMVLTILSMDLRISQATSRFSLDKPSPTAEYFQQWMIQYSKVYPNESEKQRRFEIFKNNLKYFEEFNSQGNHGYTLGVNQFTADVDIADIHTRLKAYEDVKKPLANRRKPRPTKLNPGSVLIILSGRFKGKRVVFLKQLPSGLLLVSGPINGFVPGPFKINGVPLRRVNQAYVIGTSTKLDTDGLKIEKNGVFWYLVLEKKKKDKDRKTVDV